MPKYSYCILIKMQYYQSLDEAKQNPAVCEQYALQLP